MADRNFEAERKAVVIINGSAMSSKRVTKELELTEEIKQIKIPRRPIWNEEDTKESLDRKEKDAFLTWRREIARYLSFKRYFRVVKFCFWI
jgi:large subunit GTPase 1